MKKRFLDIVPYICERWAEVVEKNPSAPFIEVEEQTSGRSRPLGYLMRSRPLGYLSPGMGRPLGYVLRGHKWTICLPVSTHGCRDMESVRKILS